MKLRLISLLSSFLLSFPSLANKPKKILFAESQAFYFNHITALFLDPDEFSIEFASNVQDAVLKWLVFQPDLVFLGMKMPLSFSDERSAFENYNWLGQWKGTYESRPHLFDNEGGLKVLLALGQIDSSDKAKVILTSSTDMAFSPKVTPWIDYNLKGKLKRENGQIDPEHFQLLKRLIHDNRPPKRASHLSQLKEEPTEELKQLREALNKIRGFIEPTLSSNSPQKETLNMLANHFRQLVEDYVAHSLEKKEAKSPDLINRCLSFFKP